MTPLSFDVFAGVTPRIVTLETLSEERATVSILDPHLSLLCLLVQTHTHTHTHKHAHKIHNTAPTSLLLSHFFTHLRISMTFDPTVGTPPRQMEAFT